MFEAWNPWLYFDTRHYSLCSSQGEPGCILWVQNAPAPLIEHENFKLKARRRS